jgi:hypothetical protein
VERFDLHHAGVGCVTHKKTTHAGQTPSVPFFKVRPRSGLHVTVMLPAVACGVGAAVSAAG